MYATDPTMERHLDRLERRNFWLWVLSSLLLLSLAGTVVSLYLPQLWGGAEELFPLTRWPIVTGLGGLTLVFCLYVFFKQVELQRLRRELFEARTQEDSLRARVFELSALFDAAGQVHREEMLESMLETITKRVLTCLEADRASILLLDPAAQELRCRAVTGTEAQFVRDCRIPIGEGVAGWVAQNNEPLVLNDDEMVRRFASEVKPGRRITTAMCLPLAARGKVIGVLNVSRIERNQPFSATDARLVSTFADHVACAIRRIEDYSDLGRQISALTQASWESSRRNRVKEIFLEASNEEIRGPLTCILAYAEFLAREDSALDPEKRTTFARILHDQAGRLEDVVTQSSLLLRLDGREARLERMGASLNDVVGDSLTALEEVAITRGVTLVRRLEPGMPRVEMDPTLLGQGIRALLVKAIQLSENGSTLRVTTIRDGDFLRAEVTGTRITLEPQDLVRAFELSESEEDAANPKVQGLALGLHLLKRVVELHGGRVWAESAPRRASSFYFAVPIAATSIAKPEPEDSETATLPA